MATFKQISNETAREIIAFIDRRNIGKTVTVGGKKYTLDHISQKSSAFHQSRGLSVYFRTGKSVVRISDHWSKSNGFDRSRKLNCASISEKFWEIKNNPANGKVYCDKYAGKYAFEMLAGICGLSALNKECDHWQ